MKECTAVILAGGRSTRFGSDKANVLWRGSSLIARAADNVRRKTREIVAVARPSQNTNSWPVDRVVFDDTTMPAGPLRGIVAGLQACRTRYAFIVPCDSPSVRPELIALLRGRFNPEVSAVVPLWAGTLQPLVAIYRTASWKELKTLLEEGERSPKRALKSLPHLRLSEEECREADPEGLSFHNVNRPEDLERLSD